MKVPPLLLPLGESFPAAGVSFLERGTGQRRKMGWKPLGGHQGSCSERGLVCGLSNGRNAHSRRLYRKAEIWNSAPRKAPLVLEIHCMGRLLGALGAPPRCAPSLPRKAKGRHAAPTKAPLVLDVHRIGRLLGHLEHHHAAARVSPGSPSEG